MRALRLSWWILILMPTSALAETATIELANGDKVTGEVVERSDERIVLVHDLFGRMEIPLTRVKPPEAPKPGLFGTEFLAGWTRTLSLGLSGQEGNTRTTDIVAALDADAENETRRWAFEARYNFSTSEGDTTKNNAMVGLGRDWLFPESRWFPFARGRFDYDEFRTWNLRLQGEGGVGYELVRRESFELRARTGPSVVQEWSEDQFRAEWMVGPELAWRLGPSQSIEAGNFFYYSFTPWEEFRNLSTLRWRWALTEDPALSLLAGVENEYQSDVDPGSESNALRDYTSVGLDF